MGQHAALGALQRVIPALQLSSLHPLARPLLKQNGVRLHAVYLLGLASDSRSCENHLLPALPPPAAP